MMVLMAINNKQVDNKMVEITKVLKLEAKVEQSNKNKKYKETN